jgi:opacity protein-like surface antigen
MKSKKHLASCALWLVTAVAAATLGASQAAAQGPLVTGTGPEIDAHAGFQYVGQQIPSDSSRLAMYGVNSGLTVGATRHFGIRLDLAYARGSNVLDTGHHSDILSYMAGPVYYPVRTPLASVYGELLLGGARMTGVTPYDGGGYVRGFANEFAWAGGGGVEFHVMRDLSMRVGADYFHTSYFDPTAAISGRGNLRAVVNFTRTIGGIRRR